MKKLLLCVSLALACATSFAAESETAKAVVQTASENLKQAAATTEDIVNTILKKSIDAATQGAEFLKDQIPDVVRQLLLWNFWNYLLWGILQTMPMLILSYFWIRFLRSCIKDKFRNEDRNFALGGTGILLSFIGGTVLFCGIDNLLGALKISIAPKVWLLEYGAKLIHH